MAINPNKKRKMILVGGFGLALTILLTMFFIFFGSKSVEAPSNNSSFTKADTGAMHYKDMMEANANKNMADTTNRPRYAYSPPIVRPAANNIIAAQTTPINNNYQPKPQEEHHLNNATINQLKRIESIRNATKSQSEQNQTYTNNAQDESDEINKYVNQHISAVNNTVVAKESDNPKEKKISQSIAEPTSTWVGFGSSNNISHQNSTKVLAEVLNEETVRNGSTLDVVLTTDYSSKSNKTIPRQTILFAIVTSVENNRLKAKIYAGQSNPDLDNINFSVYDSDGLEGIRINNAGNGQVGETARSEGNTNLTTAASAIPFAGSAVRVLSSVGRGKTKNLKAFLPAGYKLTLKPILTEK